MKVPFLSLKVKYAKRKKILGKDFIYSVDKFEKSDFKNFERCTNK